MAKIVLTQYVVGEKVKLKGKRKLLLAFLSGLTHTLAQMRRHGLTLDQPFAVKLPSGLKLVRETEASSDYGCFYTDHKDLQNPDFISELKQARYKLATVDGASI